MPRHQRFIVTVALACMALLLAACGTPDSPEERLRATISSMQEAGENGRRSDFLEFIASDFAGRNGMTRDELGDYLKVQLLAHTKVNSVITDVEVQMFDQRATAQITALLTGGPRAWFPDTGQLVTFQTSWRSDDNGDWTLMTADWDRTLGQ